MADVHILDGPDGKLRMVCHIPIPAGNNSAGVSWSLALKNSALVSQTVLKDGDGTAGTISAAEKTALENGTLFEAVIDDFLPDSATTNPTRLAYVDAVYNAAVVREQARLSALLKWFGFTRDVP